MATINELLVNNQTLTISLAGLANGSARQSTAVDNTSVQDLDASVMLKMKSGASGVTASGYVEIRAFASADGGTTYTESAGATDAALTLTSPPNAPLIGIMNMVATATSYVVGPFSVAAAFGGTLPGKWGIIVVNHSGGAFDATESNHLKVYERVRATVA